MTTPLFLDESAKIHFEKIAMPIRLSDNVDNWQKEVSSQIYKYLPFLSQYVANVEIQRANPERGYAFGSVEVQSPTDRPEPAGPIARIPIIVKDRLMAPVDVFFLEDKAYPLTEERLGEALFDGRTFEPSPRKPVDQGMADRLHPPVRTSYGQSGVTVGEVSTEGFKFAAAHLDPTCLCGAIAPTIPQEEVDSLLNRISDDQQLKVAVDKNEGFQHLAVVLATADRTTPEKTAEALVSSIPPTVVQFTKLANGNFRIKWANIEAYQPQEQEVPPQEAAAMAGSEAPQELGPEESITVGTESAKPSIDEPDVVTINESGPYTVQVEDTGEGSAGWVLPIVDFDMDNLPLFLFTDGENYSMQDEIAGFRSADGAMEIPESEPQGDGAFFYVREDGSAFATPPITIQNATSDPEGNTSYVGQDAFGNDIQLTISPELNTMEEIGEGSYAIPEAMRFTPLGNAVHLAKSTETEQVKEARVLPWRAELRCTGKNEYHLSGAPFDKLASEEKQWLDKNAAEFLLVASGLTQFDARDAFEKAAQVPIVSLHGLSEIRPLNLLHEEMVKAAEVMLKEFPYELRRDLVKEAAVLQDTETADKILAMNFLNPENVSIFASYLPQLDETVQKLAEMLVAARMGMSAVDEGALERAMKNVEEVIQGLKALQQKELL